VTENARQSPPVWFRYGVIALATLVLCSCQAAISREIGSDGDLNDKAAANVLAAFRAVADFQAKSHDRASMANKSHVEQAGYVIVEDIVAGDCQACQTPVEGFVCGAGCPIVGPRDEYLCDGGDEGLPVGVRANWQIDGLEQEDTVAHYDTIDGRRVVTPSNKVCIYAPRFGVVRRVIDLRAYARYDMATGFEQQASLAKFNESEEVATSLAQLEPSIHRNNQPTDLLRLRQQPGEMDRTLVAVEFVGSLAPYANLQLIRTGELTGDEKTSVARASLAAITWTGNQAPQITLDKRRAQAEVSIEQVGAVYHLKEPNKPRLRLVKLASTGSARPGEEVEFTLRFDNIGNRTIGNVTLVDNLTTRLEYVPESAKSSLDADFSTEPNSGGSLVLRWEIIEPLQPGEGGILQFKCRVR